MALGEKLRAARMRWKLSLREVEERSLGLAKQWGKPSYSISASWLQRVESDEGVLSATKLLVLAVIYSLNPEHLLEFCPPGDGPSLMEDSYSPNATLLLNEGRLAESAKGWFPDTLLTAPPPEETTLITTEPGPLPTQYARGIIGLRDRNLEPMVPAGSILVIDTLKRAIAARRQWNNEFDRPIYFLLTRNGYQSGFCELDKQQEWLTLLPHPLSFCDSTRWRYKNEVDVIGTVAAVFIRRTG